MNSTKYWDYVDSASQYELRQTEETKGFPIVFTLNFLDTLMFQYERNTARVLRELVYSLLVKSEISEDHKQEIIDDLMDEVAKNGIR